MKQITTLLFACLCAIFYSMPLALAADANDGNLQNQLQRLQEKVSDLEEIVRDPEGKVETANQEIKRLKRVTISGYLQTRFEHFENSKDGTATVDRFFVRRARLSIGAKPSNDLAVKVSAELSGTVHLKDAFLTWYPYHSDQVGLNVSVGQMNWPFGYEVPTSSSVRETPERALWSRKLFDGERDLGLKLASARGAPLEWEIGVFNGSGLNKSDTNEAKDLVGRIRIQPTPTLDVGVSGYFGEGYTAAQGENPAQSWVKNRYGVDAQWFLPGLTFKGEYVAARERRRKPSGWLAQGGLNLSQKDVLVVRFDTYDDDGLDKFGRIDTWNVGLIRYLDPNLRVKAFYEMPREERNRLKNNVARVEFIAIF